jgi:hypothetical protein
MSAIESPVHPCSINKDAAHDLYVALLALIRRGWEAGWFAPEDMEIEAAARDALAKARGETP